MAPDDHLPTGTGAPAYLAGLHLSGRRVLVAGGGTVAARRIPEFLRVGATVEVVAPEVVPEIRRLAGAGQVLLSEREAVADDVAGAWYVMAATNSPEANAALAQAAEQEHVFCVRADEVCGGSARTPAVTHHGSVTVAVLGNRAPAGSRRIRDLIHEALSRDEGLSR